MSLTPSTDSAEYVIIKTEGRVKFEKMVLMSQKLYSSEIFKNKSDRSKKRKLVVRLQNLFNVCKLTNDELFADAVIKSGWKDFKQFLQETNTMKLESDKDQKKLYKMLNNQKNIDWEFIKGPEINENVLKELVDLTSKLMKNHYDKSAYLGPWDSDKMGKEISDKDSECIIIRNNKNNELIGYICFRIQLTEIEQIDEVQYLECYVYELMIDEKYQRKGYGEFLMKICEFIADKKQCDYVELTVFTSNIAAIKFYRKQLKYDFDKNELDEYKNDYRILTKIFE